MASNGTRLWLFLAQTDHTQPALAAGIIDARTHAGATITR